MTKTKHIKNNKTNKSEKTKQSLSKSQSQNLVAVLSGDIIRSTDLSHEAYDHLLKVLKGLLDLVTIHKNKRLPQNKYEISRGDFFQIIVHDSENAAKYALLIRTGLKQAHEAFDCRISIGIGSDINERENVGSSTGDAFISSGRILETMGSTTLKVTTNNQQTNEFFGLLTQFVDVQISEMTNRQCAITHILLKEGKPITQGDIAKQLGAKRVSINRSMKSANSKLIIEYVQLFSKKMREIN